MTQRRRFNPDMLVLARQSRELSQTELAKLAETTQGRISKVEGGLLKPPVVLVQRLAQELRYPEDFFYQAGQISTMPVRYHRKRQSISRKVLDRVHAEIQIRSMHVEALLRAAEINADFDLPRIDIDDMDGSAEDVARAVRAHWQIPRGPIKNLMDVIERAGIIVIMVDFDVPSVDAVGLVSDSYAHPLMFVNAAMPTDRIRFTVSHELGHLIMHRIPSIDMEREADRFAGEFLMPERDIKPQLTNVSLALLASLKPVWRVAMQALLVRANSLGTITKKRYHSLYRDLSRRGYRKREPSELDLTPEYPRVMNDLFEYHQKRLGWTVADLVSACVLYEDEFSEYYGRMNAPRSGHLKLVG